MDEQDDGSFTLSCEEFPGTLGQPLGQTTQGGLRSYSNQQVDPGVANDPIIFEPNSLAAQRLNSGSSVPILCILASGSNIFWGGAIVNVSSDGGSTYVDIGTITSVGKQGYLAANLASYGGANPDVTNTLSVDLTESHGVLASASTSTDAANGVTVGIVQDGLCSTSFELLSFETVTLTGTNAYDITDLYRGQYGTTAGAHTTGALYGRLDDALFTFPMPAGYIGVALKIKLQSFNNYGNQLQDISTCTVYSYTPVGTGFGGGSGGVPATPTGLSATGLAAGVGLSWSANASTDNVTSYRLFRAAGTGASFGSASQIWAGSATSYTDAPLSVGSGYTYFLEAVNVIGVSGHTAGANGTPGAPLASPETASVVAGAALTAGNIVSLGSGGAVPADASSQTTTADGFVLSNYAMGATAQVYTPGQIISGLSSLTTGAIYYLGAAGAITLTAPSSGCSQIVGKAIDATHLLFNPGASTLL
jgi:hypothetical protein